MSEENPSATAVSVRLSNGRTLFGKIDSRTDDAELWLFSTAPGVILANAVDWSDVETAVVGSKRLSRNEFQALADELKRPVPKIPPAPQPAQADRQRPLSRPPRIAYVEMAATLGNWDRDIAPDGIEVRLRPRTVDDDVVPVNGLVTIRLYGRRMDQPERLESPTQFWSSGASPRMYSPPRGQRGYLELGHWTVRLRTEDGDTSGHLLRLPFRRALPEEDLSIVPDGQADAELRVNGQGNFSATYPVQLRSYSPLRDSLQLDRGTRYFPGEYQERWSD